MSDVSTITPMTAHKQAGTNTTSSHQPQSHGQPPSGVDFCRHKAQVVPSSQSRSDIDKDLKMWSQTFKINRPLPKDLLPLLSKDEDKQLEIFLNNVQLEYENSQEEGNNAQGYADGKYGQ